MRSVIPIVEQLDRAIGELTTDHPLNGRISLILVDNGLELMCHQKCIDLLFEDRHRRSHRLTSEQRNDARGRAFDRKIRFLKDLGHVREDLVPALAILHGYRNQLYHVGLRDDPIIVQLAQMYFRLTAGLLVSLLGAKRHLRWEPGVITEAARRLMPELATAKLYRAEVDFARLHDHLLASCPQPPRPIQRSLSEHLLVRIDEAEASFGFIAKGRSGKDDPLATLNTVQLEADTLAALVRHRREGEKRRKAKGLAPTPFDIEQLSLARGTTIFIDLNRRLVPNWKPKHRKLPFDGWRKQARSIGIKRQELIALGMFDHMIKEIDHLEDVMADPIEDMHGWHQHLEDVAMDSR